MTAVRVRPAAVALVLGRGRSLEEVKLGEALGLAYLESALRAADPDRAVLLLNAIVDPGLRAARTPDLADARLAARQVAATDPVLCGVSLVYRDQRDWTAAFAAALRELRPRCHIVVGGMYPTSAWELLLESIPHIDSVCVGEGDRVIVALARTLEAGGDPREVTALAIRDQAGTPTAGGRTAHSLGLRRPPTMARLSATELGELAFPSRAQLPEVLRLGGVIQVEASRGCNAGCVFCDARGTGWRPRPVDHLVDELTRLARQHPGALVYLVDNIFLGFSRDGSHLARGREIAGKLVAANVDIRFVIQDRAANVDRDTFALLKAAGLCEVYLGIESFADSALRAFRKGPDATAAGNTAALRTLGELEIYTQFGFLPFHENATIAELRESFTGLATACRDNPYVHLSNFNELIPYEGTYLARRYQRDRGTPPPATDPWTYRDPAVRVFRDWIWRFSVALWPVTGLIFNAIQHPAYQRDLYRTLPTKNTNFIEYASKLLALAESAALTDESAERAYRAAVDRTRTALSATLRTWPPGPARTELETALSTVDATAYPN